MITSTLDEVLKELRRDKRTRRSFPDHVAAQAGTVVEKAGRLMQAALDCKYRKGDKKQLRAEAVQVAAAALRLLEHC